MLLTMKARYALRALTALARHKASGPMLTVDIARIENIPRRFLGGIMLELRQHSLFVSRRGRGGGYTLKRTPEEITVAAVLTMIDGPLTSEPCVGPIFRASCKDCPNGRTCGARLVLDRIYAATRATLERTTIAELAQRASELAILDSPTPSQSSLTTAPQVLPESFARPAHDEKPDRWNFRMYARISRFAKPATKHNEAFRVSKNFQLPKLVLTW